MLLLAWEERVQSQEFEEDAADGPDVNLFIVVSTLEQQLRSSVVARDDVWGVDLVLEELGGSEIADLDHALLVDQNVLWLQISVRDALLVNEVHAKQDLLHVALDAVEGDLGRLVAMELCVVVFLDGVLDDLLKVAFAEFEDQVLCDFAIFAFAVEDGQQLHNVLALAESAEHVVLSAHEPACLLSPFDRHGLFQLLVVSFAYAAYRKTRV